MGVGGGGSHSLTLQVMGSRPALPQESGELEKGSRGQHLGS